MILSDGLTQILRFVNVLGCLNSPPPQKCHDLILDNCFNIIAIISIAYNKISDFSKFQIKGDKDTKACEWFASCLGTNPFVSRWGGISPVQVIDYHFSTSQELCVPVNL